ncbi:MAG: enoyl-CoA hydratase/isomerase family protein [Alphaproteobacteria bacterium]
MTDTPVAFARDGGIGLVTLRNERALNALTLDMIHLVGPRLEAWRGDPGVGCVVIEGAGERAFCAGGDVRAVALATRAADRTLTRAFFWHEYRLNRSIATLGKPYVALIDGITMGGGVGLSAHGSMQVATERTVWAMPETAIGFFPDVGASHVLNRLEPAMAAFLALTGWRLHAGELLSLGLATHYVPSARLEALKHGMAQAPDDPATVAAGHAAPAPQSALDPHLETIAGAFAGTTVDSILDALDRDGGAFAAKAAATIRSMSPTSCKVTLAQLRRTRGLDLDACLRLEFRMSQHFMAGHDFYEGIRALLLDKDQAPRWQPSALAGVSDADVDAYFAALPGGELQFGGGEG